MSRMPVNPNPSGQYSSIISKSMILLDIVCRHPGLLGFADIVARSGQPKSSVHRLLSVLKREELVELDPFSRRYLPGSRIHAWSDRILNVHDLPGLAEGELRALSAATSAHACLAVLSGGAVLYLKTVDGQEPCRFAPRTGEYSPVHCTAAGKAMAAFLDPQRREHLLGSLDLEQFTDSTITSRTALERELARVRSRGYAQCSQEEFVSICGISAPVFNGVHEVAGALGIWNTVDRQDLEMLGRHQSRLMSAAARLSSRMGMCTLR